MLQLRVLGVDKPAIWLVQPNYLVGSAPDCDIVLPAVDAEPQHAQLNVAGERLSILPASGQAKVLVNGTVIEAEQVIQHDDVITLGGADLKVVDPKRARASHLSTASEGQWYLQGATTAMANKKIPLAGMMTVGRAKECDLCLGLAHLSRHHARLTVREDGVDVEDLNSSNGTYLNNRRIVNALARAGDEIRFDTLQFRLRSFGDVEQRADENDVDKTSLRPVVNYHREEPGHASAKPGGRKHRPRSASVAPKAMDQAEGKSASLADGPLPVSSNTQLLIGFALVLVVMVGLVGYLWS